MFIIKRIIIHLNPKNNRLKKSDIDFRLFGEEVERENVNVYNKKNNNTLDIISDKLKNNRLKKSDIDFRLFGEEVEREINVYNKENNTLDIISDKPEKQQTQNLT